MFSAAKKEMDSQAMVFSEGVLSLAAAPELSENSRQGFATKNAALFLSFELRNSTTALGIAGTLALEGVRKNDRARYYGSGMGRFMSPDWAAKPATVPYAEFGDPQSLNLYSYTRNSPIIRVDGDGHDANGMLARPGQGGVLGSGDAGFGGEGGASTAVAAVSGDIKGEVEVTQPTTGEDPHNHPNESNDDGLPSWHKEGGGAAPPPCICQRNNSPANGPPDTTVNIPDGRGGSTDRTYGPDGKAVKDIDSGHPHDPNPHAHDWDWSKDPPRQPRRDLTPNETPMQSLWDKIKAIPPAPIAQAGTAAIIIYFVVSEGSRLFPPRNLIPLP
jgi:RHS repeat-associated protein